MLFCLGCFHVFDSGWVSGSVWHRWGHYWNPTSSLPPPSLSLILFLCCLTALHRFCQCRLCFLSAVGSCPVILWTFQISHPLLYRPAFKLSFSYICFLISPLLFLLLPRSAVSVYLRVPGVVWTGQGCTLRGPAKDTSDMVTVVQWKWGTGCYQRSTSASLFCWVSAQWDS